MSKNAQWERKKGQMHMRNKKLTPSAIIYIAQTHIHTCMKWNHVEKIRLEELEQTQQKHKHTHTQLRWEVCNFKLGLRKHVPSDCTVCGNWLGKTETPRFSWQDVNLICNLEYYASDKRKRSPLHHRNNNLSCECENRWVRWCDSSESKQ